jgi:hypothetical protein
MSKPSPGGRSLTSWLLSVTAPLVAVAGVLLGVIVLGKLARDHLPEKSRIEFAAIECEPPPGMTREDFLDEVRYHAALPALLELSDDLIDKKLPAAFARHSWVEAVEYVRRLPENRVTVKLRFRTPVVAVTMDGRRRAVDKNGILLTAKAPTDGLPVLRAGQFQPHKGEGTVWGDRRVVAAARTAAFLHDGREKLALTEIAVRGDELVLTTASGAKIDWGHAPGDETAKENPAERKREKLLARDTMSGEIDLRRPDDN